MNTQNKSFDTSYQRVMLEIHLIQRYKQFDNALI